MTTYTCPADLEVSLSADGVPVLVTYKAGTVTPTTEAEAQILADLERAGLVSVTTAKTTKSKPAAVETE